MFNKGPCPAEDVDEFGCINIDRKELEPRTTKHFCTTSEESEDFESNKGYERGYEEERWRSSREGVKEPSRQTPYANKYIWNRERWY